MSRATMATAEAKPVSFDVDAGRRASGLLVKPKDARAVIVLAHGAGAGMTHPFLERVAGELAEHGIAHVALPVPLHGQGRPPA